MIALPKPSTVQNAFKVDHLLYRAHHMVVRFEDDFIWGLDF